MDSNTTAMAGSSARQLAEILPALGIEPPPDVTAALAAHGAAHDYAVAAPDIDLETLTVASEDVHDLIERGIRAKLYKDATDAVRGDVIDRLGRRILRAMLAAGPDIITKLGPHFDEAAEQFTEAHAKLPLGYDDASRLVDSGADAVDAFHAAHNAASTLDALRRIRDDFASRMSLVAPGDPAVEHGTRYCEVRNTGSARRAAGVKAGPLGLWGALLTTDGVIRLRWLDVAAHTAYIAALPEVENEYVPSENNGFSGYRLVEA